MRLWDATPRNFRELKSPGARPSIIAALPPPPTPLIVVPASATTEPTPAGTTTPQDMNIDTDTPFEGACPPLDGLTATTSYPFKFSEQGSSMRAPPSTPGTTPHQPLDPAETSSPLQEPFSPPHEPGPSVDDLGVYHQIEKIGSSGRFTSNEWAMACYGVTLGGPLWDFDGPGSCVEPKPELETPSSWLPWEVGCVIC